MREIYTFVGADGRALQFAAKTPDGDAYDLTGFTATLTATYNGTTKIDDQECTLTDDSAGEFEYTPSASEIDVKGEYVALVKLDDGSGNIDYIPDKRFHIVVQEVL